MSIINFDRDLEYLRLNQTFIYLSYEYTWTQPYKTTTDAILYEQDASIYYYRDTTTDAFANVNDCRAIGLHMVGPDITEGSPYRIQGYASEETGLYDIHLFYGIGPASFDTANPGYGDTIIGSVPLVVGKSLIQFDETVYLPPFEFFYPGGGYEERPLTIFVMFRRNAGAASNTIVSCRLSVQRLGVKPSDFITANR